MARSERLGAQFANAVRAATLASLLLSASAAGPAWGADLPDDVRIALVNGDLEVAVTWLEAHSADPDAAFVLAKLLLQGRGIAKDPGRARELFGVAARSGNAEACYLLAKQYASSGDRGAAEEWMQRAADRGHARAAAWLEASPVEPAPSSGATLHAAIRAGKQPPTSASVAQVLARDAADRTPLMQAAESGSLEWVEFLLAAGVALDDQDRLGNSALHFAVASRQEAVARRLLEMGADPNVAATDGSTALHLAVSAGDARIARRLLDHGARRDLRNAAGWTPTMLAERGGQSEMRTLMGLGSGSAGPAAVQDARDSAGQLAAAARRGDLARVVELLDRNVDPEAADAVGLTALAHAAREGHTGVLELLLGKGARCSRALPGGESPLHLAAAAQAADSVAVLVKADCAVDARDASGRTPLLVAVDSGCTECAEELLRSGAALDAQDRKGRTPLISALRRRDAAMAGALVAHPGVIGTRDHAGRDALWWAARGGDGSVVEQLLRRGARPAADQEGLGPLHAAAELNHHTVVGLLLPVSDVNARSAAGNTALLLAAHGKAAATVPMLIAAGAEIDARNNTGDTALIAAVRAEDVASAELLLRAGANVDIRNARFESARSLIQARGSEEWIALLESASGGLFGLLSR